jgi:hypothetical protein
MAINVLSKKCEIRNSQEIETYLLPILKRSDYYKTQSIKDIDLLEIASILKYEFLPKDTILNELGINIKGFYVFRGL